MIKQYVIDIPFLCQCDGLQYSSIDGAILLDVLKHKDFERVFGENPVSALTSSNDLSYANELLQQAYDESKDIVDFPKYLFTYDAKNDTYVEFRHSGQGRYHGMDVKNDVNDREYQRMPSYIVDMYRK